MVKKKEHHEEHTDETWLIPYADMLTLLLALFIVMFAMSQIDKEKLQKVSGEFNVIFSGSTGLMENGGSATGLSNEEVVEGLSKPEVEENQMEKVKDMLQKEIGSEGYSDNVKVELNEGGLEISIQDVVLFNSGDAKVLKASTPFLLEISKIVGGLDNHIKIVGHTDNMPIHNKNFHSNWELSSMRAINVMNFMSESGGVKQEKMSIEAYAEYMPKFDNSTEEGRAKNRRVEIFIARKYLASDKEKEVNK